MILFIFQAIILIFILALLYLLTWFLPTDSPWSPWWTTSKKIARRVCKLVKLGKNDILYELGSGTGTTTIIAAKEFGAKGVGIESDQSRIWWSKMKAKIYGVESKTSFFKKNFFTVNLSPATVVYFYLVPRVINKLKPKLLKELKPGTVVISYMYEVNYLPLLIKDRTEQLYVYKMPSKK